MKKLMYLSALLVCMSIIVVSCKEKKQETEMETTTETSLGAEKADLAMNSVYKCPMDCEDGKTYDKEGSCPICKMDLKKVDKKEAENEKPAEEEKDGHEGHNHD